MADPRTLLDPSFVRELEALRRRLQVLVQSGASGRARRAPSRRLGGVSGASPVRAGRRPAARRLGRLRAHRRACFEAISRRRRHRAAAARGRLRVARVRHAAEARGRAARGRRHRLPRAGQRSARAGAWSRATARLRARGRGLERVGVPRRGRDALAALLRDLSEPLASGSADLARALDSDPAAQRAPRAARGGRATSWTRVQSPAP